MTLVRLRCGKDKEDLALHDPSLIEQPLLRDPYRRLAYGQACVPARLCSGLCFRGADNGDRASGRKQEEAQAFLLLSTFWRPARRVVTKMPHLIQVRYSYLFGTMLGQLCKFG